MREIHVFDSGAEFADRYTVIMNLSDDGSADFHFWTMSENALMPNGCCIYGGPIEADRINKQRGPRVIGWPPQVLAQVGRIAAGAEELF